MKTVLVAVVVLCSLWFGVGDAKRSAVHAFVLDVVCPGGAAVCPTAAPTCVVTDRVSSGFSTFNLFCHPFQPAFPGQHEMLSIHAGSRRVRSNILLSDDTILW